MRHLLVLLQLLLVSQLVPVAVCETPQIVTCKTSKGPLTIEVHREWAPLGAERFLELVADQFYTEIAFFRCVRRFLTQFGISDKPEKRHWHNKNIADDPNLGLGIKKNYVSFAGGGPNTRSTQIFIAFENLDFLGKEPWETPFGVVIDGQATLDALFKGYGDIPPFGSGPDQQRIFSEGNGYVRQNFPEVDFLESCAIDVPEVVATPEIDIESRNKVDLAVVTPEHVQCDTTKGPLLIEVHRNWSPNGANRFLELVQDQFYTNIALYRCVKNFLVQFGISDNPEKTHWHSQSIKDDPNLSMGIKKNYVSFAGGGPNTRTTQIFIAFRDLDFLGKSPWETPFGVVIDGQETLNNLYKEYGDMPPFGKGPSQQKIFNKGNQYVRENFPDIDFLLSCSLIPKATETTVAVAQKNENTAENRQIVDPPVVEESKEEAPVVVNEIETPKAVDPINAADNNVLVRDALLAESRMKQSDPVSAADSRSLIPDKDSLFDGETGNNVQFNHDRVQLERNDNQKSELLSPSLVSGKEDDPTFELDVKIKLPSVDKSETILIINALAFLIILIALLLLYMKYISPAKAVGALTNKKQ